MIFFNKHEDDELEGGKLNIHLTLGLHKCLLLCISLLMSIISTMYLLALFSFLSILGI